MITGKITSLILSLVLVAGVITIVSPVPFDDALASGDKQKNGKDRDYDDGKDREDYKQYDKEYNREYMKYQPDYYTGEEYDFSDSY